MKHVLLLSILIAGVILSCYYDDILTAVLCLFWFGIYLGNVLPKE